MYPNLSYDEKLVFVRRMACAFQTCWSIRLPEPRLTGELIINADIEVGGGDANRLNIGPDRRYSLGDPFSSVSEYF